MNIKPRTVHRFESRQLSRVLWRCRGVVQVCKDIISLSRYKLFSAICHRLKGAATGEDGIKPQIVNRPVFKNIPDVIPLFDGDKQSSWPSCNMPKTLTRFTHCGEYKLKVNI